MKAKLRVLIRRVKRSIQRNREQWIKGGILAVILLIIIIFAGSCACGKKNASQPDAASTEVMKSERRKCDHGERISFTERRPEWK